MGNTELKNLLTIIIPTLNEELHLPRALKNIAPLGVECFIVDSESEDQTTAIAKANGCQVVQGRWDSFSVKMNWALQNLPIRTPWVMRLDADEYLTDELITAIRSKLPCMPEDVAGLWVGQRLVFLGRWLRHGGRYPSEHLRIMRVGKAQLENCLNDEKVIVEGKTAKLGADLVDEPVKGLIAWTRKHLRYAMNESYMTLKENTLDSRLNIDDGKTRWIRFAKVMLYARLPLFVRPFLYWFYRYIIRLGFLDGTQGFIYHFLQAFWYRCLVDALIFEAKITNGKSLVRDDVR